MARLRSAPGESVTDGLDVRAECGSFPGYSQRNSADDDSIGSQATGFRRRPGVTCRIALAGQRILW